MMYTVGVMMYTVGVMMYTVGVMMYTVGVMMFTVGVIYGRETKTLQTSHPQFWGLVSVPNFEGGCLNLHPLSIFKAWIIQVILL